MEIRSLSFCFNYSLLAELGLLAARGLSQAAVSRGDSPAAAHRLPIVEASLAAAHGLQELQRVGSGAVLHGPSCPAARGIFLDWGWKPRALHWLAGRFLPTAPAGKSGNRLSDTSSQLLP